MEINMEELKMLKKQQDRNLKWKHLLTIVIGVVLLVTFGYFFTKHGQDYSFLIYVGGLVFGMVLIIILWIFLSFYWYNLETRKFLKALDKIINDHVNTGGNAFYQGIITMNPQPKTFDEHVFWYFNLSTALYRLGKYQESLDIVTKVSQVMSSKHYMYSRYQQQEEELRKMF